MTTVARRGQPRCQPVILNAVKNLRPFGRLRMTTLCSGDSQAMPVILNAVKNLKEFVIPDENLLLPLVKFCTIYA